jgi:RNA polymerase sigma factor (sigma-70 family)
MSTASLSPVVTYIRGLAERDARALTDRQLLDRFTLDQDEGAFAELVRRHGPMVLSVCRRALRHEQDAEDAFQAAFLILARKAGDIRERDSVGGWIYCVAQRVAMRARAVIHRRRELSAPLGDAHDEIARAHSPVERLCPSLEEELRRLPEPYRSAVVLCYLEGRTQNEAAHLLTTTAAAINSRLKRARELLRRRLAWHGLVLSGVAVAEALAGAAQAALSPAVVRQTARTAIDFVTCQGTPGGATAFACDLAKGALHSMISLRIKIVSALALLLALLTGGLFLPAPALGDPVTRDGRKEQTKADASPPSDGKARRNYSVIFLWMSGGPSQLDTFDLKPGTNNGGPFKAIDTAAKRVQISEHLPLLAKQANHLAIIRSLSHREGDHVRATFLMRTGYVVGNGVDYPTMASALAKELSANRLELPPYVSVLPFTLFGPTGHGPGFLGSKYAPVVVGDRKFLPPTSVDEALRLPPVEVFEELEEGKGKKRRDAVAKAFDLSEEKPAVLDRYGRTPFGQGCLLARRLVERGVPVVEVTLPGWDAHQDNFTIVERLSKELDAGWAALLKDLDERKKLDTTLIVWMGEFGRTPRINVRQGRDHYPLCCTAVLAGAGIKGGQAIGKTSADGLQVDERPVSPAELAATIYRAVGIDPARENRTPGGQQVPLVEKGTDPVKEALR